MLGWPIESTTRCRRWTLAFRCRLCSGCCRSCPPDGLSVAARLQSSRHRCCPAVQLHVSSKQRTLVASCRQIGCRKSALKALEKGRPTQVVFVWRRFGHQTADAQLRPVNLTSRIRCLTVRVARRSTESPYASVVGNILRAIISNLAQPDSSIGLSVCIVMTRKFKNFFPIFFNVSHVKER